MRLRFIGILAVLAMIMAFAAAPVAADHGSPNGGGTADCPAGTTFIVNFTMEELKVLDLEEGDEVFDGVTFVAYVFKGETDEVIGITVLNETGGTITLAVKGGSDQVGNASDPIPDGQQGTVIVAALAGGSGMPAGLSNLSICAGPFTPTLTLDKAVTGIVDPTLEFGFTLDGLPIAGATLSANDDPRVVATTAAVFDLVEQLPEGWAGGAPTVSCVLSGTTTAATTELIANGVRVTVGADQDVTCTFTNNLVTLTALSPTLTLDKNVTGGNPATAFQFSLGATALAPLAASDAPRVIATTSGQYTITETVPANWSLVTIGPLAPSCVLNGTTTPVASSLVGTALTVTVGEDQDVTCTFTNAPEDTLSGGGGGSQVVRQGTLAGSLPNTAMNGSPVDQAPVALLALVALGSVAYVAQRNVVAMRNRR